MDTVVKHPEAVLLETYSMSWNKDTESFTAFASDCGFDWVGYMWKDCPDRGVWLRSHRTGNIMPFLLTTVGKDAEQDTRYWQFVNTRTGYKLTIFNT